MNQTELETRLGHLHLGSIRFFEKISSTNDEAANWVKTDCPDLALVVADEQTAGRGRGDRKWYTPAGSALAFSVVLRVPKQTDQLHDYPNITRLNGLGALAVCQALQKKYQLPAQIKWPNDILVNGQKLSGVLVESHWIGNQLTAVVLGIGINVATKSVPPEDWDLLNSYPFPATCIETLLGTPVRRWELLSMVLEELLVWRKRLSKTEFMRVWQDNLAYQGEWVQIIFPGLDATTQIAQIVTLEEDGALQVRDISGSIRSLRFGEIHCPEPSMVRFQMRPVDSTGK